MVLTLIKSVKGKSYQLGGLHRPRRKGTEVWGGDVGIKGAAY